MSKVLLLEIESCEDCPLYGEKYKGDDHDKKEYCFHALNDLIKPMNRNNGVIIEKIWSCCPLLSSKEFNFHISVEDLRRLLSKKIE